MAEHLIALLESWGIDKAASQVEYLLDFPEVLSQIWETVYAPAAATLLAYVIGLPLGVLLVIGEEGGVRPLNRALMRILNIAVNLLRSVPFLILMALIMPLSRLIIGTSVGTTATIVPLTVAAGPYVARIVEISLREMDRGVIEAAHAGVPPLPHQWGYQCRHHHFGLWGHERRHRRRRAGGCGPHAGLRTPPAGGHVCGGHPAGDPGPDHPIHRYRLVCEVRPAYQSNRNQKE